MDRFALLVIASLAGCSYQFGSKTPGPQHVGVGWDSGLAFGRAMQAARDSGDRGTVTNTSTNCFGYWSKPLAAGTIGTVAFAAVDGKASTELAVGLGVLVVALAVLPNCVTELTFAPPVPQSAPPPASPAEPVSDPTEKPQ